MGKTFNLAAKRKNRRRAASALTAIVAYHRDGHEEAYVLGDPCDSQNLAVDLMANLLHWCRSHGMDTADVARLAITHFDKEVAEETVEVLPRGRSCPRGRSRPQCGCSRNETVDPRRRIHGEE